MMYNLYMHEFFLNDTFLTNLINLLLVFALVNREANEAEVIFGVASENDEDLVDIAQTSNANFIPTLSFFVKGEINMNFFHLQSLKI